MIPNTSQTAFLTPKAYEILKWLAAIVLPAISVLYFALSEIWGLPKGAEVSGTIAAVNTFVGAIVGFSTMQYNKNDRYQGVINVLNANDSSAATTYDMVMERAPETIAESKEVTFRVNPS